MSKYYILNFKLICWTDHVFNDFNFGEDRHYWLTKMIQMDNVEETESSTVEATQQMEESDHELKQEIKRLMNT